MPIINEVINNFGRGMYHANPITDMPEGSSTLMRNIALRQSQYIGNRKGHTKYTKNLIKENNQTQPISGIHQYDNGSTKTLIVTSGTKVYIYDTSTEQYTEQAGVTVTTGYKQHFVNYYDSVIMYNGVDRPLRYNGTAWSELTNAPIGVFMEPYRGNLFAADNDNRDRVSFSELSDPTTWNAADFDTVSENRLNDQMISLRKVSELYGAIALSKNEIWTLQGGSQSSFAFYPFATGTGSVSHESFHVPKGIPVWLDEDGFHTIGQMGAERFSELDSIMGMIDQSRIGSAWGTQYKGSLNESTKYLCGLTIGEDNTSNNQISVLDIKSKAWSYDTMLPCDIITRARDSNDKEIILGCNNTDGYVYQLYTGISDDGKAIPASWISYPVSGRQMLGDAGIRVSKYLKSIDIWYRSKYLNTPQALITADMVGGTFPPNGVPQAVTFEAETESPYQYSADSIDSAAHILNLKYAKRLHLSVGLDGYYFQLRLDNFDGLQDWEIYAVVFNMAVKGEVYGIVKASNLVYGG